MYALQQLHSMIGQDEEVLWSGKPNLKCFILESIFNPLLPFAIVWALFDGFFIFMITRGTSQTIHPAGMAIPLIFFFALHLMPVWIYLGGVLFSSLRHKNAAFLVTDKGVYTSAGTFSLKFIHKPFTQISQIDLNRGIFDRMLGVGDVIINEDPHFNNAPQIVKDFASRYSQNKQPSPLLIYDIPDYQEVYALIKDLQQKAQAKQ